MPTSTRTRYANAGEFDIAYQVLGEGPIDLLVYTGAIIPIDCMDEEPSLARFHRRLTSFARLVRFDRRGIGLSDRGSASSPPTMEQVVRDAVAVLDAVGCERAAVLAPLGAAPEGLALAATHSERVSQLIIVNGTARFARASDYPDGLPQELFEPDRSRLATDPDAVELGIDFLAVTAPSVADDHAFRAWLDRAGNLGATPAMARALNQMLFATDVRHLLPLVSVPTLVMQRVENPVWGVAHGRYLAEHIARAKLVELRGADLLYWVGDTKPMLDEIEEFLTGVRGGSGAERVLATVLFTDIVGSTDKAAQLGDGRWRDLLELHDQSVRIQIERFRGREVKAMGDGFVATFDGPGRAIDCALAIRETLKASDIAVRTGIHTGEIEVRGDDVAGMAVHIGARVASIAEAGEVLVSSTVKDLVVGSEIEFVERGEHKLKGVPGSWKVFAVQG